MSSKMLENTRFVFELLLLQASAYFQFFLQDQNSVELETIEEVLHMRMIL